MAFSVRMSLVTISAFASMAHSVAWKPPRPTDGLKSSRVVQGFTPRPTEGPNLKQAAVGLFKRDYEPNVCGYESGYSDNAVTCSPDRSCYFYTQPNVWGMRGCCSGSDYVDCGWAVDCVDLSDYSSRCGLACQADSLTLKCTDSVSTHCQFFKYNANGVLDYGCDSTPATTYRSVSLTYDGEAAPSSFNYAPLSLTHSFSEASASATDDPFGLDSSNEDSDESDDEGSDESDDEDEPTPPLDPKPSKKKKAPVGAIAGGVVGGVAAIAGVVSGILLCLRRKRRNSEQPSEQAPPVQYAGSPNTYQPPPPDVSPPQPFGFYPPPDEKSQQAYQPNTQSYYGGSDGNGTAPAMTSVVSPFTDRALSPANDAVSSVTPVSPAPTYSHLSSQTMAGQGYTEPSQLHADSVVSPIVTAKDGTTVHEISG
ncbi:MAG: hypothetical protein M1837_006108 [Sclerophora amabilis]|nr:MAG: hypothetical protein M1837_006108 [Sclerophora amabilis]